MANPHRRTLALGAAAALASVPAVVAGSAAGQASSSTARPISFGAAATSIAQVAGTLASSAPAPIAVTASAVHRTARVASAAKVAAAAEQASTPVRGRTLLVRIRGGHLRQITVGKGLDPIEIAATLRQHPNTFTSAGADFIATAADEPTDAAGTPLATPATTPAAPGAATLAATSPVSSGAQTGTLPTTPDSTTPLVTPVATPAQAAPTIDGIMEPPDVPGASTPVGSIKGWVPNDHIGVVPWTALQWNFAGKYGVGATEAWQTLRRRGKPYEGGRGVRVAIVDSGVAYRNQGDYRASPDLPRTRILRGYDFVDDDRFPDDQSGHGTHVASTVAGATNNNAGLTGLAYNAEILPVRVLDDMDSGDVVAIARGIRYAARHHAQVMNMSIDFPVSVTAAEIPEVMSAIAYARSKGVLMVASSGNAKAGHEGGRHVGLPSRSTSVLSVGSTTVRGCRSSFANAGPDLDLSAPGGGPDRSGLRGCHPSLAGPPIAQITILDAPDPRDPPDPSLLGVPLDYVGTSMAAGHVTGVAALVIGSGVLGKNPSADLLAAYLVRTARDLGTPGRDDQYGAGLIDAATAVSRTSKRAQTALRGAQRAAAAAIAHHQQALPVL